MRAQTRLLGAFLPAAVAGALALALIPSPGPAQELKFQPVDEAGRDPSLAAYRAQLLDAVRRRDTDFVVAGSAADIRLSFGGDAGSASLRKALTGTQDWEGEAYWKELQRILELGGVFLDDGSFCTPYTFCLDVPGCPQCDPFETVIVVRKSAVARARPQAEAPVVAQLSYDVLRMDADAYTGEGWFPVFIPAGGRAFVSDEDARMPIDYRARFEKIDGRWLMTVFIAGD